MNNDPPFGRRFVRHCAALQNSLLSQHLHESFSTSLWRPKSGSSKQIPHACLLLTHVPLIRALKVAIFVNVITCSGIFETSAWLCIIKMIQPTDYPPGLPASQRRTVDCRLSTKLSFFANVTAQLQHFFNFDNLSNRKVKKRHVTSLVNMLRPSLHFGWSQESKNLPQSNRVWYGGTCERYTQAGGRNPIDLPFTDTFLPSSRPCSLPPQECWQFYPSLAITF